MNPHQQQAIITLLQQLKNTIVGLEQLILMAEIPSVLPNSNPPKRITAPGTDLKEDEDDALTKLLAKERAEAAQADQTLQQLWSQASAPRAEVAPLES